MKTEINFVVVIIFFNIILRLNVLLKNNYFLFVINNYIFNTSLYTLDLYSR